MVAMADSIGRSSIVNSNGTPQPSTPVNGGQSSPRRQQDPNHDCQFQIREVWAHNLEEEMENIREVIEEYPYVSMDTEFPGVVARPLGKFKNAADFHYQTLRCNVDLLRIIQLGITFTNEYGHLPKTVCTWQFNFEFSLHRDMYAEESIELLRKSGIDFKRHERQGIDVFEFGEVLISSGLVLLEDVRWVSFHSGYDFGYLLKLLTCSPLPIEEVQFFNELQLYFPCIYDIKYLMRSCKNLKGGLQEVADTLGVSRVGPQHQAGSDSLLTALTFFKLREVYFDNLIDDSKYLGRLFGLGIQTGGMNSRTRSQSVSRHAVSSGMSNLESTESQS